MNFRVHEEAKELETLMQPYGTGQILPSRSIQRSPFREHVSEEGEKPVHVLVHYLAHGLIGKHMNAISCTWRKPSL